MIIYDKIQTFKCDKELDSFLKSLPKKSNFIRVAILEKKKRENLTPKVDKRKKVTMDDLKRSFNDVFTSLNEKPFQ